MSTTSSHQSSQHSLEDHHTKLLESRKYILLKDHVAKSKRGVNSTSKPRLTAKHDDTRVCRGSLWEEKTSLSPASSTSSTSSNSVVNHVKSAVIPTVRKLELDSIEFEDVRLQCPLDILSKISEEECRLLLAIPVCEDRYKVYIDSDRMSTAKYINVGSDVIVQKRSLSPCRGQVKWKGRIAGKQGIWFGVEITEKSKFGCGDSDGSMNKIRLFECMDKNGVIVNVSNVNLIPPLKPMRRPKLKKQPSAPSRQNSNATSNFTNGITPTDSSDISSSEDLNRMNDLRISERVVWAGDNGWEKAIVRWIGTLPDDENTQNEEVLVGVEFDNPVGKGTGIYKNKRLFSARKNHASLVPLEGLYREDDILGDTDDFNLQQQRMDESDGIVPQQSADDVLNELGIDSDSGGNHLAHATRSNKPLANGRYRQANVLSGSQSTSTDSVDNNHTPRNNQRLRSGGSASPRSISTLSDNTSPNHCRANHQSSSGSSQQSLTVKNSPLHVDTTNRTASSYSNNNNNAGMHEYNGLADNHSKRSPSSIQLRELRETPMGVITEGDLVTIPGNGSCEPMYGVVRWIGRFPNSEIESDRTEYLAGVELDQENSSCTYGTYRKLQLVKTDKRNILFVKLSLLTPDERYQEVKALPPHTEIVIPGKVPPNTDLKEVVGRWKGVQGDHNSCYMDASLFSMFAFSTVFDEILDREAQRGDIPMYNDILNTLRHSIVNPLRRMGLVYAESVHKLRSYLDNLGMVEGLKGEEKDPEEFIGLLLNKVFRISPLILSTAQDCNTFHLFGEKDARVPFPSVQQLLENSCAEQKIKFKQVPSCMIMHMPRCGKNFKLYERILPDMYLDVTDLLIGSARECTVCGEPASTECPECYIETRELRKSTFCNGCTYTIHKHQKRKEHMPVRLDDVEANHRQGAERSMLELFSVICIEKSHYVSFCKVKCQCDSGSRRGMEAESDPWVFLDSMADRENSTNIPEVTEIKDLSQWLSPDGYNRIAKSNAQAPPHVERLLNDAYICFYRNPEQSLYS